MVCVSRNDLPFIRNQLNRLIAFAWKQRRVAAFAIVTGALALNANAEECSEHHCPADLNGSSGVDVDDMLLLLGNWSTDGLGACIAEDTTIVDTNDLLGLLAAWGECPPPPDPDNDICAAAMELGTITTTTTITDSLSAASIDNGLGLCNGVVIDGPGRWYRIVGNGSTCIISACTPGNDDLGFDLRLNAFCGSCDLLNCVVATDDDECGAAQGIQGELELCTAPGVDYFILAHMADGGMPGAFELVFGTAADACTPDAFCTPVNGACCTGADGTCTDAVNQFECASLGGIFYEALDCGDFSCPGANDYRYDDGTHEDSIAASTTGSTMWIHRFETPDGQPRIIDTIETTLGVLVDTSDRNLYWALYQGDGSGDMLNATLIDTGAALVDPALVNSDIAQVIDITDHTVQEGFYVAFWIEDVIAGETPAPVDGSAPEPSGLAFYAGNSGGGINPADLASITRPPTDVADVEEIEGVWLIRADE